MLCLILVIIILIIPVFCGDASIILEDELRTIRSPRYPHRNFRGFTSCVWLIQAASNKVIRMAFNEFTVNGAQLLVGNGRDPSDEGSVILSRETSNVPYYVTSATSEAWVLLSFRWDSIFVIDLTALDINGRC